MKILILTNHLAQFGGSEMVALEVAEKFANLGHDVNIFSAYIDDPVRSHMDEMCLQYDAIENCPSPESFDIIWSQHQLISYLLAKYGISSIESTFLVNTSLSPYEPLEIPGAVAEIADMVVANSPETAARLIELGVSSEKISVFYNAAPDSFNMTRKSRSDLESALIISNHMPEEVAQAAAILRNRGLIIDHIGLPSQPKKITPAIISSYDAVISIGKSVQYSILCETPVYVYDRFGGPGWLNEINTTEAEKFNFSGRCCHRQLSPETIADEISKGYPDATLAIRKLKETYSEKYTLRNYLTEIIEHATNKQNERQKRQVSLHTSNLIYREGLLSNQLITLYQLTQNQSSEILRLVSIIETERESLLHPHEEFRISYEQEKIDQLQQNLSEIKKSTSWKITEPLRKIKRILSRK